MNNRASATRYAKALFDVAVKESLLEPAQAGLAAVADLTAGHAELQRTLTNPALPNVVKRNIVQALAGRLELVGPVAKLLGLLADRGRLYLIADLRSAFDEQVDAHHRILKAELLTAEPLDPAQASAWESRLSKATGRPVVITTRVDPALLGGVQARIGSTVFDGSLATQLSRLRGSLVDRL